MAKEPVSTEQPMTLENVAKGAAPRFFEDAMAELIEAYRDEDVIGKKSKITFSIEVTAMGEGAESFFFAVQRPTIKFPARKGVGNIARCQAGVLMVDVLEQEDGNRAIPFTVTMTSGSKPE